MASDGIKQLYPSLLSIADDETIDAFSIGRVLTDRLCQGGDMRTTPDDWDSRPNRMDHFGDGKCGDDLAAEHHGQPDHVWSHGFFQPLAHPFSEATGCHLCGTPDYFLMGGG